MLKATPQKSVVRFWALVVSVLLVLTLFPGVTPRANATDTYQVHLNYDRTKGKIVLFGDHLLENENEVIDGALVGETLTLIYKPASGYKVESAVFGEFKGTSLLGDIISWHENDRIENGTFVMPAHDVYIKVSFVPIDLTTVFYTLSIPQFEHGKVETVDNRTKFNERELVQLKVTPDEGYEVAKLRYKMT